MENALDVELHDEVLVDEIRLVTELMVVATMAPGRARAGGDRRRRWASTRSSGCFPQQRDADWRRSLMAGPPRLGG